MRHPQDSLHLLLIRHRRFLEQATVLVAKDMNEPKTAPYRELLLLLTRQLFVHKTWLSNIEKCYHGKEDRRQARPSDLTPPVWGLIIVTRRSCVAEDGNRTVLQIDGPADGDTHTVAMASEQAATAATIALARAADQTALACDLPTRRISTQPLYLSHGAVSDAAAADAAHIALLKEYNDLRDIAQQLIGIIADNRGVPARSLYTDRSFGISIDD